MGHTSVCVIRVRACAVQPDGADARQPLDAAGDEHRKVPERLGRAVFHRVARVTAKVSAPKGLAEMTREADQ